MEDHQKPEGSSIGQPEIALPVTSPEKSPLEEKPRTEGHGLDSTWEKEFWKKLHKLCLKCTRECKQSARVKIIACNFEAVKKEKKNEQ